MCSIVQGGGAYIQSVHVPDLARHYGSTERCSNARCHFQYQPVESSRLPGRRRPVKKFAESRGTASASPRATGGATRRGCAEDGMADGKKACKVKASSKPREPGRSVEQPRRARWRGRRREIRHRRRRRRRGLVVLAEQGRGRRRDGRPTAIRSMRCRRGSPPSSSLHRHAERRELRVHAQMDAPRRVLRA